MYVQYLKSFHYFRNIACFDRQFSFRFIFSFLLYVYILGTPANRGTSNYLNVLEVEKGHKEMCMYSIRNLFIIFGILLALIDSSVSDFIILFFYMYTLKAPQTIGTIPII